MFTRIVTYTDAKDIDKGTDFVREVAGPVLHSQRGWRSTTASADRGARLFAVLTVWETEADRDASESALLKVRNEGQKIIGGRLGVEYYEQVKAEVVKEPTVGSKLLATRVSMDPAKVAANIASFDKEVTAPTKSLPGFLALRLMVNRKTGEAILGTVWADDKSRRNAIAAGVERERTGPMPVTIIHRSERDILFVERSR